MKASIRPILSESDLHMVWARQLFLPARLMTEASEPLEIEFPGIPSLAGPDFRSARVRFAGELRAGDVELHLVPSGWGLHRHRGNVEFSNVILHVSLWREPGEDPTLSFEGRRIPQLVLQPFLTGSLISISKALREESAPAASVSVEPIARILDAEGDRRLGEKIERAARLMRALSPQETLYREFMSSLGFRQNRAQFEELATILDYRKLNGCREILAALEWVAGFSDDRPEGLEARRMDRKLWRRRGVRPANKPDRRMHAAAAILTAAREDGLFETVRRSLLEEGPQLSRRLVDWARPHLGATRAAEIVQNVVVPCFIAHYRREEAFEAAAELRDFWRRCPAPPDNFATRTVKRLIFGPAGPNGLVRNVRRHQGLLGLYARSYR